MDYEKAYKEAFERAKQVHASSVDENKKSAEYIFPQLKESEDESESKDEKIKEALINFFGISAERGEQPNGVDGKDILAWLERQDKKSQDAIDEDNTIRAKPKFKVGDLVVEPKEGESNGLWRIEKIEDGYYWEGFSGVRIEHADKYYHLWTIEDAKDGNALAWWLEKQGERMQEAMWKDFKEQIKVIQHSNRD